MYCGHSTILYGGGLGLNARFDSVVSPKYHAGIKLSLVTVAAQGAPGRQHLAGPSLTARFLSPRPVLLT